MSAQDAEPITLAISGSNLTGDVPFSVALRVAGAVHVRRAPSGQRGDLVGLCRDVCAEHDVEPSQLRRLHIDVGPGSYTGLRVAVTFVRFLQSFGDLEVRAVDSLALLALHGSDGGERKLLRPLLDARRGRYHTGLYEWQDGKLVEREPQAAPKVADAMQLVAADQHVVMPAAFAEQVGDDIRARGAEVATVRELTADLLLREELPLFVAAAEDLEPRYLMASYAED